MIQLLSVFIGCIGFGMLFHLQSRHYLRAALGGVCTYLVYMICSIYIKNGFIPVFLASASGALYAEVLARIQRAPTTLYLIIAVISLVPGSSLFYTMSAFVREDWNLVHSYGVETAIFAVAIALGMSLVWAIFGTFGKVKKEI